MAEAQSPDDPQADPPTQEYSVPGHAHAHPHLPTFKFFEELKRRNVGRVGVLYIIVSYLVLEVFSVFVHLLELPAWIGRSVVALAILGFPVALLIAWIYEITPEGLKPIESVAPHQSIRHQTGKRLDRAIIVVLAVALCYFVADKFWLSKRAVSVVALTSTKTNAAPAVVSPPEKSIAVLPFTDMSEKHDQEYFSDGLSDELIDMLAKINDMRVPSRTSSFFFKGKQTTLSEIAHQLGVAHLLQGSVRKSGNKLRVTAQLIRADSGYQLWSDTYDRDLRDIFKLQDDIATAVVQALKIKLVGGTLSREQGGTQSIEAYQLYLRGRSEEIQNSRASLEASRDHLNQATVLDPSFGLAWVWLARNFVNATDGGFLPPKEGYESARQMSLRALSVSPNLSEARAMLGYVLRTYDRDWSGAEAELRQAVTEDPANSDARAVHALLLATLGRWNDAESEILLALTTDPLNPYPNFNQGMIFYGAGRFADAERSFQKTLALSPHFIFGYSYLAKSQLAQGKVAAALDSVQREREDEPRLELLPIVLRAAGQNAKADAALEELIQRFQYSSAYNVALAYAQRGDHDLTFTWLDRAYMNRDNSLAEIVGEPLLGSVWTDPRYTEFLRKLKLAE